MKNRTSQIVVTLTCVLTICFMTNYAMSIENSRGPIDEYLSVRDSLIPMFGKAFSSETYNEKEFPFNRLNPKTREYIRFYIEEDNVDREIGSVGIWLLGFIGDKDDILFIEQYIDNIVRSSSKQDEIFLTNLSSFAGCFTGMMLMRNIDGAESFLKKYAKVSSWMTPGEEDNLKSVYASRDFYSLYIMSAYQYSKSPYIAKLLQEKSLDSKPYFHESFAESYLAIKVDKYTELMKAISIPEKRLNENIAKCLEEYGEWIDRLLRKQTYVEWQKEQEEKKNVTNTKAKPDELFEIVDLSETVEGDNIKTIVLDAAKEYIGIPANRIVENILIDTKILKEIKAAGLKNFNDFKVKADIEAAIDNFVPSIFINRENNAAATSEPNIVFNKVNANITFDIQGSADILKKYGPDAAHKSIVSPNTGDLKAVMIKTNDGWLWAPFTDSPLITDSNIVDNKYLIDSANKAIIAYNQISQSIIDENYDPLKIPVLDNGKLIPQKKREKDKDGMAKALDLEKKILEDLAKEKLNNYNDFQMKVTIDATVDNGTLNVETGAMPKDVKGYETIDLTFMIPNGAEVYKNNISERMDQRNIDGKGNLQVSMKKINGTWYWNPFGW